MSIRSIGLVYAFMAAVLMLAPIRAGDLAGYDDAMYAHIGKNIVRSGEWLNLTSNGHAVMEHPPLLPWTDAVLFQAFGFKDWAAKLPSALSGVGVVLLTWWLGARLLADELAGVLAMFVMATSHYFIKYAARAMTDVPCTFLFVAAICCWVLAEKRPEWYLAAGAFTGLSLIVRGFIGFALPLMFVLDFLLRRRKLTLGWMAAGTVLAIGPLAGWYTWQIHTYGPGFFPKHKRWLDEEVWGPLDPPWRRYTGLFEYLWMMLKSYWPWLPFLSGGLWVALRQRSRRLGLLVSWSACVLALCAITRSRVLRYLLPAFPAFALLSAAGLIWLIRREWLERGLRVLAPVLGLVVLYVAIRPPVTLHAAEVKAIAPALDRGQPPGLRIAFYDDGAPRFDELNQLQWYGSRTYLWLPGHEALEREVMHPRTPLFLVDNTTLRQEIEPRWKYQLLAAAGHLSFVRLTVAPPTLDGWPPVPEEEAQSPLLPPAR